MATETETPTHPPRFGFRRSSSRSGARWEPRAADVLTRASRCPQWHWRGAWHPVDGCFRTEGRCLHRPLAISDLCTVHWCDGPHTSRAGCVDAQGRASTQRRLWFSGGRRVAGPSGLRERRRGLGCRSLGIVARRRVSHMTASPGGTVSGVHSRRPRCGAARGLFRFPKVGGGPRERGILASTPIYL